MRMTSWKNSRQSYVSTSQTCAICNCSCYTCYDYEVSSIFKFIQCLLYSLSSLQSFSLYCKSGKYRNNVLTEQQLQYLLYSRVSKVISVLCMNSNKKTCSAGLVSLKSIKTNFWHNTPYIKNKGHKSGLQCRFWKNIMLSHWMNCCLCQNVVACMLQFYSNVNLECLACIALLIAHGIATQPLSCLYISQCISFLHSPTLWVESSFSVLLQFGVH